MAWKKEEKLFHLVSEYKPTGDQPQAIETACQKAFKEGNQCQTLLGVTVGNFTMANVIQQLNKTNSYHSAQ